MKHLDKETLSQLMDGEWQDIDEQARISELCSDPQLKATWARYHLIRDVMKNESVSVNTDISSRVFAALENEPAHTNVTSIGGAAAVSVAEPAVGASSDNAVAGDTATKKPASRSLVGGFALAASVALATVFGLNFWNNNDLSGEQPQAIAAVPSPQATPGQVLPEIELVANRGTYWVNQSSPRDAAQEKRLNMFLSQHIENSPTAGHRGMLPYSRLVGYDPVNQSAGQ